MQLLIIYFSMGVEHDKITDRNKIHVALGQDFFQLIIG